MNEKDLNALIVARLGDVDVLALKPGEKVALSLSGGLDSITLLYLLAEKVGEDNVYPISFDYNQRHSYELLCAQWHVMNLAIPKPNYRVIDVSFMGDIAKNVSAMVKSDVKVPSVQAALGDPQPASYMPFRNLVFASLMASFAESNGVGNIALGIQRVDQFGYWDTSLSFVQALQRILDLNRKNPITLWTPFVEVTKVEEIGLGLDLGIDYTRTWTCYNGPHMEDGSSYMQQLEANDTSGVAYSDTSGFTPLELGLNYAFDTLGAPYACGRCVSCADRRAAFDTFGASYEDVQYLKSEIGELLYPTY